MRELDMRPRSKGTRFGRTMKTLGRSTGARGIGCTWYEQPPKRTAFPRHFHCANEEALFVLEGEAEVHIGGDTLTIRAGDYVTFPTGPEQALRITNSGTTPLRYLCISTLHTAGV